MKTAKGQEPRDPRTLLSLKWVELMAGEAEPCTSSQWSWELSCAGPGPSTVQGGSPAGGLGPGLDPELSLAQWEGPQSTLWAPTSAVLSTRRQEGGWEARGALTPVRALRVLQGSPWC